MRFRDRLKCSSAFLLVAGAGCLPTSNKMYLQQPDNPAPAVLDHMPSPRVEHESSMPIPGIVGQTQFGGDEHGQELHHPHPIILDKSCLPPCERDCERDKAVLFTLLEKTKQEIVQLSAEKATLTAHVQSITARLDHCEEHAKALIADNSKLSQEKKEAERTISNLQRELEGLTVRLNCVEQELKKRECLSRELNEQLQASRRQVEELERLKHECEIERAKLGTKLDCTAQNLSMTQMALQQKEHQLALCEEQVKCILQNNNQQCATQLMTERLIAEKELKCKETLAEGARQQAIAAYQVLAASKNCCPPCGPYGPVITDMSKTTVPAGPSPITPVTPVQGGMSPLGGNPLGLSPCGVPGGSPVGGSPGGNPAGGSPGGVSPGGSPAGAGPGGSPAGGSPGGSPAGGSPGGSPGGAGPGGSPAGGSPGGSPAGAGPGGSPAGGSPGGSPAGGSPGGSPAGAGPGGSPAGGSPGGSPVGGSPGGSPAGGSPAGGSAASGAGGTPGGGGSNGGGGGLGDLLGGAVGLLSLFAG